MPRSKTGKKRDSVDSTALKNALEAIFSDDPDEKLSFREAEKVFNVNRMTISRHAHKFKDRGAKDFDYSPKYALKKIFSELEEECLVEYIQTVAKVQYGLTKKGVRQLAYNFAKANDKKYPETWDGEQIAGEEWMRGFLKRHSTKIAINKPEATSFGRATISFNRHNVQCFHNIRDVYRRFGPIPQERIWNMEEIGISTVEGQSKIVAPKGVKQISSATSVEKENFITMITAVNAVGNSLPPMLIFPSVFFNERMLLGGPAECIGVANLSGWSSEKSFLKYLDHFLSSVKCSKEYKVLLIVDNHETHLSIEALEKASAAGVVMVTFPHHTSHKDISVYSPLKTYYSQAVEAWLYSHVGNTFDIYSVAEALGAAYPRTFTPQNILSSFRKSGIYPLDTGMFTDDFLSGHVTDRPAKNQQSEKVTKSSDNGEERLGGQSASTSRYLDETIPETSSKDPGNKNGSVTLNIEAVKNVILPFPRAAPRKKSNRRRAVEQTFIAMDTPEKQAENELKEKKNEETQDDTKKKTKCLIIRARSLRFSNLKAMPGIKRQPSDKEGKHRKLVKGRDGHLSIL